MTGLLLAENNVSSIVLSCWELVKRPVREIHKQKVTSKAWTIQMPTIFALSKCRQGGNNREEISDANDPAQLKKKIELQTELT